MISKWERWDNMKLCAHLFLFCCFYIDATLDPLHVEVPCNFLVTNWFFGHNPHEPSNQTIWDFPVRKIPNPHCGISVTSLLSLLQQLSSRHCCWPKICVCASIGKCVCVCVCLCFQTNLTLDLALYGNLSLFLHQLHFGHTDGWMSLYLLLCSCINSALHMLHGWKSLYFCLFLH
jgi:hypothetical protein